MLCKTTCRPYTACNLFQWAQIPESKYYKAKHQEEVSLKKKETESNIEEIKSGQDEKKRQKKKVEIRKLLEELHGVDPRKVPFG